MVNFCPVGQGKNLNKLQETYKYFVIAGVKESMLSLMP